MSRFLHSSLTQEDVAKLLAAPAPALRAEIAEKLGAEIDSPRLSEQELKIAQDIVRILANDVAVAVRQALAQSLRMARRLPHDVAVKLARDVEKVALPILTHSPLLTDEDLAAILRDGNPAKQEAIARRANISGKTSEALIEHAGEKAVTNLVANESAEIREAGFLKIIDRYSANETIKEKIAKRPVLPVTVTERLVALVSDNLKNHLASHHELPPAIAADIVMQSRERAILGLSGGSSGQELAKMVSQMHQNKRLTPSILLRALCLGDIAFFETAIAVIADIPLANACILIHEGGRLGLESLYERAGMPKRFLPAVCVAIDVVHETQMDGGAHDLERYRARVIERVLTQYQDFGSDDLDYLFDKLGDVLHKAA